MKVDEIIASALRKIQVTAPSANEKNDAMEALNDIRKELFSGGKQGQHAITVDTHTLTVSTGSYTIGTGATIDTLRPSHIEAVFVVQNDIGYNVKPITAIDYAQIADKTQIGIPRAYWYNPTYTDQTDATIYLWPEPDYAYTLYLYSFKPPTDYSALDDDIVEPPEYHGFFKWAVALEMAPEFGRQITPFMFDRYQKNERIMKRAHMQTIPIVETNVVNRPGGAEGGLFVGTVRFSTLPFTLA
jgi:hypothetical protein